MTTRERFWTAVFAGVLAVLIWLWAEGENRDSRSVSVTLRFESASDIDGDFLIRVQNPNDPAARQREIDVNLILEGPNLALQRMSSAIERLGGVRVPVSDARDGAVIEILIADALQALPLFANNGLTVVASEPVALTLVIDEIISRPVRISTKLPGSGVEADAIVVRPDTVDVAMTAATWQWVDAEVSTDLVRLNLQPGDLTLAVPGQPFMLTDVSLVLDPIVASQQTVRFKPRPVTVELTLRRRIEETTWNVPVRLSKPPREEQFYDVLIDREDELIAEVLIAGPTESIARLRNREIRVFALIDLSSDELERGIASKQVEWVLPDGLTARMADGGTPVIPIHIVKRAGSTGSNGDS